MGATTEIFRPHTLKTSPDGQQKRFRRTAWALALPLLSLQFLPFLLLWDEAYLRIHDTLEGIDYQNLFRSGKTFDYAPNARIEQLMNGLPRAGVKTGWSFIALWHWLFGLYGGYIFNYVLVHVAAFFGMYRLLRGHLLPDDRHRYIVLGVSLCFAWVPVFTMLGMSVAGQPWVAWAFLKMREMAPSTGYGGKPAGLRSAGNVFPWLVFLLFPFYSDIVWAGIPVLGLAGLLLLRQFWKTGRWNWHFFTAIACMTALYVAGNWQLFATTFLPGDFVSHRLDYHYFYNKPLSVWHSLKEWAMVLLLSHHHVGIFVSLPIAVATAWAWRRHGRDKLLRRLAAALLAISFFYGFYNFLVWAGDGYFVLLKSFKFERVVILLPVLWLVLFASVLSKINRGRRFHRTVGWLLAGQFLLCLLAQDEFAHNLRQLAGQPRKPNFQAFFDEKLFADIDRQIGLPKETYRVVSLGMHPSVAQFNGFYTLDCHASLYDLRYKRRFRQIMAGELAKNPVVQKEFDQFGNRCYLFSAELGKDYDAFLQGKNTATPVQCLDLDAGALCGLGGCYLLSAVEILNAEEAGLRLLRVFEGQFWRVHLYEVVPIDGS